MIVPAQHTVSRADKYGIFIASLCLIHCLFFPLLLVLLPITLASILEGEWIHMLLAALTVPLAYFAMREGVSRHGSRIPVALIIAGIVALWAPLLFHELHDIETLFVSLGAVIIVGAHLMNFILISSLAPKNHENQAHIKEGVQEN